MISTEEYRKIISDYKSSEEDIKKKLSYIEAFCRNIARLEIENYIREQAEK